MSTTKTETTTSTETEAPEVQEPQAPETDAAPKSGPKASVQDFFPEPTYSPYGVCKVVNRILELAGANKVLPPQMFYTYASKGMLGNEKGTKVITQEQAVAWTTKYLAKHLAA